MNRTIFKYARILAACLAFFWAIVAVIYTLAIPVVFLEPTHFRDFLIFVILTILLVALSSFFWFQVRNLCSEFLKSDRDDEKILKLLKRISPLLVVFYFVSLTLHLYLDLHFIHLFGSSSDSHYYQDIFMRVNGYLEFILPDESGINAILLALLAYGIRLGLEEKISISKKWLEAKAEIDLTV